MIDKEYLWELFKEKAEAVSAELFRFSDKSQAYLFIKKFIDDLLCNSNRSKESISANIAVAERTGFFSSFEEELKYLPIDLSPTKKSAASAEVGISEADFAIADTGSIAMNATSATSRLVSALPPINIMILDTNKILPDMNALFTKLNRAEMSYISFITGPSRTADIERVLTIGVHGPKRLIVVAVDNLNGVDYER